MDKMGLQWLYILLIYILESSVSNTLQTRIVPSCEKYADVCEFNWTVEYQDIEMSGVFNQNETTGCDKLGTSPGNCSNRTMMTINGAFPGPAIVVYEGQQILVRIQNKIPNASITFHWHGITQRGTAYKDKVMSISQCPINPHQSFIYRLQAAPTGTHWFHSEPIFEGSQGLSGPLIVLAKSSHGKTGITSKPIEGEFIFFVQDVARKSLTEPKGSNPKATTYFGLINGKMNNSKEIGSKAGNMKQNWPETFVVGVNKFYKFRLINAASVSILRLSIDQHEIILGAIDGYDVEEIRTDFVVLSPGERADVYIYSNSHGGNAWIRTEILSSHSRMERLSESNENLAVLHYKGVSDALPRSRKRLCSKTNLCTVVNCWSSIAILEKGYKCVPLSKLKSRSPMVDAIPLPLQNIQEIFLNLQVQDFSPKTIAEEFELYSSSPLQVQTENSGDVSMACIEKPCLETRSCRCKHVVKLKYGHVIQMVVANIGNIIRQDLTVHIHGHNFHVLKTGFPKRDLEAVELIQQNQDLQCDSPKCFQPKWSNRTMIHELLRDLNLRSWPVIDTAVVPWNGYTVIRFMANNPGYWSLKSLGIPSLSVILQEGDNYQSLPFMDNFSDCGLFSVTKERNVKSPELLPRIMESNSSIEQVMKLPRLKRVRRASGTKTVIEPAEDCKYTPLLVTMIALLSASNIVTLIYICVQKTRRRWDVGPSLDSTVVYKTI